MSGLLAPIRHCPICGHRLDTPDAACTNCHGAAEFAEGSVSSGELSQCDDNYAVRVRRSIGRRAKPQRGGR
jgi:hypothetical protein